MSLSAAHNYKDTMRNAAEKGYIGIVKLMLNNGAKYYNNTMKRAAKGGYIDIVYLILEI